MRSRDIHETFGMAIWFGDVLCRFLWIGGGGGGKDFVEEFYSTIRSFVDISASLSFCLLVNRGDDCLHGEIQPFVEGDCSVSILIHGGEHVFPVLITKGRQAETELLGSLGEDVDEGDKLTLVNLAIPVSICGLESFPVEEIERLAFI